MTPVWLICRRDLAAFFRTTAGYIIVAAVLLVDGVLFNAFALGGPKKPSSEVLQHFFYYSSGTTMIAGVLLSMRLVAEERQSGSLTLLYTSPVRDAHIAVGKFLSGFLFLALMTAATVYMPLLIFVKGKVSLGHIAAGYLGLLLLGAATVAIGVFGSALARSQVVAAVLSGSITVTLILFWLLAKVTDEPFRGLFGYLALHNKHFTPFQRGLVNTQDLVYYASVTFFFLLCTTRVLESRRWR